ncbi:oligosaccharide flippase family protein [Nitrosomonas sp.]|uniref:oligosaccharide flippase family protein n=1 Tax=Nitrosomonas sp. TaxID=42353 RepID=UPI001DE6D1A4|nr:oligosaccharide flippase family protein [Nitrosomonas sp.]MBX3616251.1 oligosaccharide flippase family protein [Nitrosomonas sp.]
MSHSNPGKLAKNTLFLYFRLILVLGVSLYTSQQVLAALGIEDYGIHNVVAGVVLMLSFLNGTMASGTQRFLSFELGRGQHEEVKKVFSTALLIHIVIALIIFLLAETIGLWFLYHVLEIPEDRLNAAHWVFQCAVVTFMITVIQVPYLAAIFAQERMGIYAYISLLDVAIKLINVFILVSANADKLILYGILNLCAAFLLASIYVIACRRIFPECRHFSEFSASKIREMFNFVGWNLSAHLASAFNAHGSNILLNIFFGPATNAARGIAMVASNSIQEFVNNFQVASAPQITKTYSAGEIEEEKLLILSSCKISFFLLLLLVLPVFLETDFLLKIWLKNPPAETSLFLKLILIDAMICTSATPMYHAIMATGNIRNYQLIASAVVFGTFLTFWILLELDFPSYSVFCLAIISSLVLLQLRLRFLYGMINFSTLRYFQVVVLPGLKVALLSAILPLILFINLEEGFLRLFLVSAAGFCGAVIFIFYWGLNHNERAFLINKLKVILKRE